MDHVILNHGQVTWMTPELAPPLLTTKPHQREDVSALDRFNVHRCPTRRVFSGTGLEPMTKKATQHTAPTTGVMVWGVIAYNTRSPLVLIRGTMPAQRVSQDCLRTVTTLPWPARSPDLSPIEHIWNHLRHRVRHPTSLNELEAMLQQIWNEMSQDIIQNLYASMPDRIASCIRAKGGSTSYSALELRTQQVYKKRFSILWSKVLLYCDLGYLSTTEKMPRRRIRAHYEQLSEFERGRINGLKEAGWADRRIARHMDRSDVAIRRS
ncbi:transposable element Tcb1 transposase [Trichonephila clavipes]|uniref:Transposable element Tcb1 transposase n=1 Tax=Trichonephila clavipes TaxID=2585209 RepID=A0A8X6R9P4_TRICX|nr:transposable element Tcb1 transposase [Trichonephila clavipes]